MTRPGPIAFVAGLSLCACACAGAPKPSPVTPATTPHAPTDTNPFVGARLYVDPHYTRAIEAVAAKAPAQAAALHKLAQLPTAIWLDKIEEARKTGAWLDDAVKQQASGGQPVVPVLVVYDVPGRDCNAEASAGELNPDEAGEGRYQHEYIDTIAAALAAHPNVKVAIVLEPDSLGNLVTNTSNPRCAAAEGVYKRALAYAIAKLSLPNVYIYVDAAHGGWLGWPKNLKKAIPLFKEVLDMAGGPDRIRGFAVNVSNYNPVKDETAPPRDPNATGNDELTYVDDLVKALAATGITGKGFVIDTARDGRANIRTAPGNWCNIKGAGLGERPRAAPAPNVDAYLYIKPPGESDGVSDPKAKRFDSNCASDDAAPGAPQAGEMFESYLLELVKNANPPL